MKTDELYYPPLEWYESKIDVLTMDELIKSNKEPGQPLEENQEYDFLMGKIPEGLPDHWEEEE